MPQRIPAPDADEFAPYYQGYVQRALSADVPVLLNRQPGWLRTLCAPLSDEEALARYAPGKWSIKEVLGHISDAERIFAYRALRIARGDATPLASFDENAYVAAGGFDRIPLTTLLSDFEAARAATLSLVRCLGPEHWELRGVASGHEVSVRAVVHILAGHVEHHAQLLRERYGLGAPDRDPAAG